MLLNTDKAPRRGVFSASGPQTIKGEAMDDYFTKSIKALQLAGKSERTQQRYIRQVRLLVNHYHKTLEHVNEDERFKAIHVSLILMARFPSSISKELSRKCGKSAPREFYGLAFRVLHEPNIVGPHAIGATPPKAQ